MLTYLVWCRQNIRRSYRTKQIPGRLGTAYKRFVYKLWRKGNRILHTLCHKNEKSRHKNRDISRRCQDEKTNGLCRHQEDSICNIHWRIGDRKQHCYHQRYAFGQTRNHCIRLLGRFFYKIISVTNIR